MSRKLILAPVYIATSQSLSSSFNSAPTIIDYMDNCSYQINITTTNSTGTFSVQGSLDYVPQTPSGPLANSGNWADLALGGGTPSAAAANDVILIELSQVPFRALRIAYTSTIAGTGTCDIIVMNKAVGS